MPQAVAVVASHRGLGVFVVPEEANDDVLIQAMGKEAVCWLQFLKQYELMRFRLPREGFSPDVGVAMVAVFAQFGTNGEFKSVPRLEVEFDLQCVPELDKDGPCLGVRPVLLHTVSPLADTYPFRPTLDDDVIRGGRWFCG